jgi:predicted amidohydrolase
MKITLYQFDLKWLDKAANLSGLKNIIDENPDTNLIILPEMFNTGYIMKPDTGAESLIESPTVADIQEMIKGKNMIIGGSIPTVKGGKYYNSFIFISDTDIIHQYNKIHLFKMAGEGKEYTAGDNSTILEINGVKIRPLICYDLRFPYISFQQKGNRHDVLIYTANWPVRRISHWRALLQARAIENQCYVIGVNRVGQDGNDLSYNGNSLAIDYAGNIIADLGTEISAHTISIDTSAMYDFRTKLPFIGDAIID